MVAFLASLLILMGGAQSNPQPKLPPAVDAVAPGYQYSQRVDSLRDVDFKHFDLVIFDRDGKVQRSVRLKNGEHHGHEDFGDSDVSVAPIQFFGVTGSDPNYVLLGGNETDWGGASKNTGIVQVIGIAARRLHVLQQFTFDSQAPGTGITFDAKSGNLIIRARSNDGTPSCCPEHIDVVHFHWNGRQFEQQAVQTLAVPGTAN
ncbi:MAG: hypothetical protein WA020_05800 [Candidatus Acidiferrales bacterium]